ncbi:hypothetical protein Csa_021566 [Cucumis sativus]|nr:hypothetical protein Csa_021566 [Cucumis sativus]
MCPLRFILLFLSAILAGYFAWRSASSSSSSSDIFQATEASDKSAPENENRSGTEDRLGVNRMVEKGFWTFVDMASGRFLWRNLNGCFNSGHVMIEATKAYGVVEGIQWEKEKGLDVVWLEMGAKTIVAKVLKFKFSLATSSESLMSKLLN